MNAKENLTCKYCNQIYKDPIALPCGDIICKQHIDELITNNSTNKFLCPLCNKENLNQNFEVNKLIQNLIESNLHKFEVDPKFKIIFDNFKIEINNLEAVLKDSENIIYEEINELKRQVDLDREKLKSEIDTLADDLIQQLESYGKKFKAEYKDNVDSSYYTGLVESSKKQLDDYERCLNLFSTTYTERKEKSLQIEKITVDLQPKITQLKQNLFSNTSLTYKQMENSIKDLFGKLIVKNHKRGILGNAKKIMEVITSSLLVLENNDLVTSYSDNSIKIWDINEGKVKKTLTGHNGLVWNLILYGDDKIISASGDKTIKIWNINEGTLNKTLLGHTAGVLALKLVRNRDLASASADKTIKLWDIEDGTLKKTLTGHDYEVWALELLTNGDLVSSSSDKTIKVWDVDSGTVKKTLTGHTSYVYALTLLENGDLVSGSDDKTIKVWNIEEGTVKKTLTGHTHYVNSLKVLNRDLVSGSHDGTIKIWDVEAESVKKNLYVKSAIHSFEVFPNGDLVSATSKSVIIWE